MVVKKMGHSQQIRIGYQKLQREYSAMLD